MRLSEYMALKGLSDKEVARDLGVDRKTITIYRNGGVKDLPSSRVHQIEKWSGGAVRLEDWLPAEAAE